ncbi:tRNA-splicing ligase RtcB [Thermosipho atlanticus DSM 15807]|uniref:tRNA-splicing ligase RtcB n=2 Tax=Thermosipho TaxID=2420 RepID=A0A1M5TKF4_9BACT|nr:tRNA-splicing ligase RtcB [Thermosipho atlanticus DSM 15807]
MLNFGTKEGDFIRKITKYVFEIPKEKNMKVDAYIFTDEKGLKEITEAIEQLKNVASLPGIVKAAYGMPDIHWGYGFPIGGVAAFDVEEGIISPGGVGFDINCGVRLLKTPLLYNDVKKHLEKLIQKIYEIVPVGVGSTSKKFNKKDFKNIIEKGVKGAIEIGYGYPEDLECIEDNGHITPASIKDISNKAYERGREELGTLGAGNHFIEIQMIEQIYDKKVANKLGIVENQIIIMIHTGSRGFGHQVATDYIQLMRNSFKNLSIPDKQLIYAPFKSELGQKYFSAMNCAANYAFVNRQIITHYIRIVLSELFNSSAQLIYDVAHNIAKLETHIINNELKKVIIHRKGATRAFGPNRNEIPQKFKQIGQPVIIPGDMGTASYLLVGTDESENIAFSSTAHGAGRLLGRRQAIRQLKLNKILSKLHKSGIIVKSKNKKTIIEEAPEAYKDIDKVIEITNYLSLSKKIARMIPLGVIKG